MVALPVIKKEEVMKILDIQSVRTNETRTDGRYPLRIGSTVDFYMNPLPGCPMVLDYVSDNQGNPKSGCLRTSTVVDVEETKNEIVITTVNSIYHFEK